MNLRGLTNEIDKKMVYTLGFVRLTGLSTLLNVLVCTKIVMGPQVREYFLKLRYMIGLLP